MRQLHQGDSRPARGWTALVCALAVALAGGCTQSASAHPRASQPAVVCPVGLPKALLVAAGADDHDARLFRIDPCTGVSHRVGSFGRVSSLAASTAGIVLAVAQVDVDQVYALVGDRLVGVLSGTAPTGSSPVITSTAVTAYVSVDGPASAPFDVYRVERAHRSLLLRTPTPVSLLAAEPSGDLLLAEQAADPGLGQPPASAPPALLRLEAGGRAIRLALLPRGGASGLTASDTGLIAISSPQGPGQLLDRTGHLLAILPAGARVQAFVAGSTVLLVAQSSRIGLLEDPAHSSAIRWLKADLPVGIVGVVAAG